MSKKTNETKGKNPKKLLFTIAAVLACIMLVLWALSFAIDMIEKKRAEEEYEIDYNFYPADFDENIFEDEKYISLTTGEFMRFCDSNTNVTLGIDRDSASKYGVQVEFIVDMIYDIINGDHSAYNSKFSEEYYQNHSPKQAFTMQKVYDVTITYISSESDSNYTKSFYCIEYKIYENNGTFRKDIGSGSKKQYLTVSDASGELKIDSLTTQIVKNK